MDVVQGNALKLDVGAKQALSAVTPWVGGEGEAAQSQVSNAGPLFSLSSSSFFFSLLIILSGEVETLLCASMWILLIPLCCLRESTSQFRRLL
jgi:hypothetical protein